MQSIFTLHVAPQGDVLAAARDCELEVFARTYGNSRDQWEEEYGPYESSSFFLVVTDGAGDAAAAMRIIRPGPSGLKTLTDTSRSPWFVDGHRSARAVGLVPERTWDVATVAMRRKVPNSATIPAVLYHGLFHAARVNAAEWIVMILDARVRRLLNMLGIMTQALPGTRSAPYLGSESSTPLWGELARMADWQRRNAPEAHRLVNLGLGMDGFVLPTRDQFVLADRSPMAPRLVRTGQTAIAVGPDSA